MASSAELEKGMSGLVNDQVTSVVYADNAPDPDVKTLGDFRKAAAKRFNCAPDNIFFTDISTGNPMNSPDFMGKSVLELPEKLVVEVTSTAAEGKTDVRLYETTFVLSEAAMKAKANMMSSSSSSSSSSGMLPDEEKSA